MRGVPAESVHQDVTGKRSRWLDLVRTLLDKSLKEARLVTVLKPLGLVLRIEVFDEANGRENTYQKVRTIAPDSLDSAAIVKGRAQPLQCFPHNVFSHSAHVRKGP